MTRKELEDALAWGRGAKIANGGAYVYANALNLLIEAAEAHLKTMPAPKPMYVVTAWLRRSGRNLPVAAACAEAGEAAQTATNWREIGYHDVQITEIESHG